MSIVDLPTLKSYFSAGAQPTESNFVDLIDTLATTAGTTVDARLYGVDPTGVNDSTAGLNTAWAAVSAGDVLTIPPGTYAVTDTVSFTRKSNVTIMAENALIITREGSTFTDKTIVDVSGSDYLTVRGLRIESNVSNKPRAGLVLGRVSAGDGVGQLLDHVWVSGVFAFSAVYDVGAELTTHLHCRYHTTDDVPCYYTSNTDDADLVVQNTVSNVCKRFYSCTFVNYGSSFAQVIELHGISWEVSLRDCYVGVKGGCHAVHLSGTTASTYGLIIDNLRVEGANHADSRLLFNGQDHPLSQSTIGPFFWTIQSDYVIDMDSNPVQYSILRFNSYVYGSTKLLRCNTVGNSYNLIEGRGAGAIYVENGGGFYANYLIWFSNANPIAGYAYGADYYLRQDNVINRLYDTDTEVGMARQRTEGAELNTGTTPSVAGMDWFTLNYDSGTTITNFTNAVHGQKITLITVNGNATIAHGTTSKLNGSTDWTMPAGSTLTLLYNNSVGVWYEVGRMTP